MKDNSSGIRDICFISICFLAIFLIILCGDAISIPLSRCLSKFPSRDMFLFKKSVFYLLLKDTQYKEKLALTLDIYQKHNQAIISKTKLKSKWMFYRPTLAVLKVLRTLLWT